MKKKNPVLYFFSLIKSSIQLKLTILIFTISLIPLIILGIVTSRISSTIIEQNVTKNTIEVMDQVMSNIDFYLKDMEYVSSDILFNKSIIKNINNYKGVYDADDTAAHNEIRQALINMKSARSNIKAITIVTNKFFYFSTSYGILPEMLVKQQWYKKAHESNGRSIFTAADSSMYTVQNGSGKAKGLDVVLLAKKMRDIYSGKDLGILEIDLDYKTIEAAVSKLNPNVNASIYLVDRDGNIIYKNVKNSTVDGTYEGINFSGAQGYSGVDIIQINGEKILSVYKISALSGWKLIELIPYKNLMAPARFVSNLTILLVFICLFATLIISVSVSKGILKPLKDLEKTMNKVEIGDLNVHIEMERSDEIGSLSKNFNNMIKQLREMKDSIYREQEAKREAELSALQAQINPHFLYNTLDSIKWMAMVNGQNNICEMITALVSLLRSSINKGREIIAIREEINNVKNFIQIQRLRYYDTFDVIYDLDETLMQCRIPKLILQPLVENALFHGLNNTADGGRIYINLRKSNNNILIEVIDNGKGMDKEELEGIYTNRINQKFSGVGIKNVDERLKLHFGEQYGLKFFSEPGKGTKVEVLMPITYANEKEDSGAESINRG